MILPCYPSSTLNLFTDMAHLHSCTLNIWSPSFTPNKDFTTHVKLNKLNRQISPQPKLPRRSHAGTTLIANMGLLVYSYILELLSIPQVDLNSDTTDISLSNLCHTSTPRLMDSNLNPNMMENLNLNSKIWPLRITTLNPNSNLNSTSTTNMPFLALPLLSFLSV
jgi:hypothetical protein